MFDGAVGRAVDGIDPAAHEVPADDQLERRLGRRRRRLRVGRRDEGRLEPGDDAAPFADGDGSRLAVSSSRTPCGPCRVSIHRCTSVPIAAAAEPRRGKGPHDRPVELARAARERHERADRQPERRQAPRRARVAAGRRTASSRSPSSAGRLARRTGAVVASVGRPPPRGGRPPSPPPPGRARRARGGSARCTRSSCAATNS